MPKSLAEIRADKDLLRADFAISTRRLEMDVAQLKESDAGQRAAIGRKDDIINRFRIERDAQNVELLLLKAEVGALRAQFAPTRIKFEDARRLPHDVEPVSTIPDDSLGFAFTTPDPRSASTRELTVAADRRGLGDGTDQPDDDALPIVAPVTAYGTDATANIIDASFDQNAKTAREPASASAARMDSSIHLSPGDHLVQEPLRTIIPFKALSFLALVATVGAGIFVWKPFGDETKKLITNLTQAVGQPTATKPPNAATAQQPDDTKAAAPVAQQIEELTREVTDMRNSVQQLAVKQEQTPPQVEKETNEARLTVPSQSQPKLAPVPETPPTTIPGWIVRDVVSGTAVVQGPTGIWRVGRGDTLPGLGKVDSIVHWGNHWIVATGRGLISTP